MQEIDEFELLLPWEETRFLSGPGTMPAKDAGLPAELERDARAAIKVHQIAAAGLRDILRRGQVLKRKPKYTYALEGQYKTNFGFLVLLDELSEQEAWHLPFCTLVRTDLKVSAHYRSMDEKAFEVLALHPRQYRLLWGKARQQKVAPFVSPVAATRILNDHSIEMTLRDGGIYKVTVMDNPRKGLMYNLRTAFSTREYPLFVDPSHLRVKRLRRGRKVVWRA